VTEFDLIVLGGGTGNVVASAAAEEGEDVALVERGPLGGTCLNRGCNPSKMLLHRANVVETVRNAESFGVEASVEDVAFESIVDEVNEEVAAEAEAKAERARENDAMTLYRAEGRFVDEDTVEVESRNSGASETIRAENIVLAGGSQLMIPDSIDGTDEVGFLTSAVALELRERPDRLVIVGGGHVAVEMAHFFGAMGAEVVVVGRADVLASREDRDVAERLTDAYADRYEVHTGYEVTELAADDRNETTTVRAESEDGDEIEIGGDEVLLATGRRPNADSWNVEAAGIDTDEKGFVETDEYLETSADGVWAIGDVAGNYMFKHSGDKEAEFALRNAVRGERASVEYPGMAHAIFGSPEVGSLGKTEGDLDEDDGDYDREECAVGTFEYADTALGSALDPDVGFAKAIAGPDGDVLGFHVIGPHASILVHEVSTAVAAGTTAERIAETIHVHPALSEVVQGAFRNCCGSAPTGI